jgi:RNA polymerase sigma-70 factor (ECF subfamily)
MRDSFSSDRFRGALFDGWLAEATAVARRLSARHDIREDLTHEALLRVLEHPPERENAGAWIQRICRNLHVDAWRAADRARRIEAERPASPVAYDGEEEVLAREQRRVVRRALLALPRAQRRALILRFYGGWSFDRIAQRLGMRAATMRTRVHRALAALRTHVAALRVWLMPGALSLKPAIAVLIVFAAGGSPLIARRSVPSMPAAEPRATTAHAMTPASTLSGHRRAIAGDEAKPIPALPKRAAEAPVRAAATAPAAIAPAVQRLTFEDDEVPGELQRPDGIVIEDVVRAQQSSLIELRRDFEPEIFKSFEDL